MYTKRRRNYLVYGAIRSVKASLLVAVNISTIRDRNIRMSIRINGIVVIMDIIGPAVSIWDLLCKTNCGQRQKGNQRNKKKRGAFFRFHTVSLIIVI